MFISMVLLASVTALSGRPALLATAPVTPGAQLLQALDQAEDDFARVKSELGLVGSAPLIGEKAEAPVRHAVARSAKAPVQKASAKTRRH